MPVDGIYCKLCNQTFPSSSWSNHLKEHDKVLIMNNNINMSVNIDVDTPINIFKNKSSSNEELFQVYKHFKIMLSKIKFDINGIIFSKKKINHCQTYNKYNRKYVIDTFRNLTPADELYVLLTIMSIRYCPDYIGYYENINMYYMVERRLKCIQTISPKLMEINDDINLPDNICNPYNLKNILNKHNSDINIKDESEREECNALLDKIPLFTILSFLSIEYNKVHTKRIVANQSVVRRMISPNAKFVYVANNQYQSITSLNRSALMYIDDTIYIGNRSMGKNDSQNHIWAYKHLFDTKNKFENKPVGIIKYIRYDYLSSKHIIRGLQECERDSEGFLCISKSRYYVLQITEWVGTTLSPGTYSKWIWRGTEFETMDIGDILIEVKFMENIVRTLSKINKEHVLIAPGYNHPNHIWKRIDDMKNNKTFISF